jgi:broad specificity phosphatase PhoE
MRGGGSKEQAGKIPLVPFFFVRHGETDWNRQGLLQGSRDVPLNETGLAQAHDAARALAEIELGTIVASPLSRARQTAEIVAAVHGLDIVVEPKLVETSWGIWEGTPHAELLARWYAGETPEGAESFSNFCARIAVGIAAALTHPAPVLIVAHGGSFAALRAVLTLGPGAIIANAVPVQVAPGPWRVVGV